MKIRKRPQKKSLWNILLRAVKKRIWLPGLFALLLGTDEALKQYAQEYLEPGKERVLPGGKSVFFPAENFCTVRFTIRDLHLEPLHSIRKRSGICLWLPEWLCLEIGSGICAGKGICLQRPARP